MDTIRNDIKFHHYVDILIKIIVLLLDIKLFYNIMGYIGVNIIG